MIFVKLKDRAATNTGLASWIKDSSSSKDGGTRKMVNYA